MSNGSADGQNQQPHRGQRLGLKRRLLRWWYASTLYRGYGRLADSIYDWWHPSSESARSYYGYQGRSRRTRLGRAWNRLKRWIGSFVLVRAWDRLQIRLHDWWYPLSSSKSSRPGYGYSGHRRRSRAKLAWRSLVRWLGNSAVAREWNKALNAFYNWWYPLVEDRHAYPAYGYQGQRRRSRPALMAGRFRRWWRQSWIGRAWERLLIGVWQWWYPEVESAGGGYGYGQYGRRRLSRLALAVNRVRRWWRHSRAGRAWRRSSAAAWEWWYPELDSASVGYGYGRRRVSRPVRFLRRSLRWFRKTWLGRKLKWLLDDLENLAFHVSWRVRQEFGWWRIRQWMTRWQTWTLLSCLVLGTVVGYFYGLPRYHAMMEYQYSQQAQVWLRKGDLARAMLRARQTLSLNQSNAIANRVFGDVAERYGSPLALYWRQRTAIFAPSSSNQLALASTALKFESFPFPTATKALSEVEDETRATPHYHLVAGAMALKMKDLKEAERHYSEALKLDPDNSAARLSLAVVRLHHKDRQIIADARATLEGLVQTNRSVGLLALRSLVAESMDRGDLARAELLSNQVLTNDLALFSDRILHLAILKAAKRPHLDQFLKETQDKAGQNVLAIGEVVAWMNAAGYAREALAWLKLLPPDLTSQGFLPVSRADAYIALGEWKHLEEYLLNAPWPGLEHIRFAMLTLTRWKQTGGARQSATWSMAQRSAAVSPGGLSTLAELAVAWGWMPEAEDTLWVAVDKYPNQDWPLQALDRFYTARKDTAGFRRLCAARLQRNPEDPIARNNYAMASLLLNADMARAQRIAEELHATDPGNPVFVSTYAFSLHTQGRTRDAVSVLRGLGLEQLNDPAFALYYGIMLALSGESEAASPYLKRATNAFMWPEELALLHSATPR